MPRLSHTQMRRLTALVRLEGAERVPLDNNVQDKLVKENYATRNGNGNLTLTEDGQNEIERLSTIMGLIKK
jgi:hypothetical protein